MRLTRSTIAGTLVVIAFLAVPSIATWTGNNYLIT